MLPNFPTPGTPHTVAIIQARMSSSRLPGKVLLDLAGQPMLVHVVERVKGARTIQDIVVATTNDPSDDPIEQACAARGYACFRGSLHDVLDRYYQAARASRAGVIVRITADCPLIDPAVVDRTVEAFHSPNTDFCANRLPPPWGRTLPIGLDVEVVSFTALERAWKEADQPFQREHVMPYFYEGIPPEALHVSPAEHSLARDTSHFAPGTSHLAPDTWHLARTTSPRGFGVAQLHHQPDYGTYRWTVDTPADLELLRRVYQHFEGRSDFSWREVLALFEAHPELAAINAAVQHKTAFDVDHRASRT